MNADDAKLKHRASELFDRLLDLDDSERDEEIARMTSSAELRARLQRLLAAHRKSGILDSASIPAPSDPIRVGDWKILEEIGRGGMAVVYHAQREIGEGVQEAAVKLLTVGALAAHGRERFLREQAILSRLDHPNIAGFLDAGVLGDGTPWLAMVRVEGQRIDDWCSKRALDPRAIVSLFIDVCSAVAYAHRSLVVHRDLKPSNILVDNEDRVRLLDFGIAQLIEEGGRESTANALLALTPRYAAPEQFGSEPTTTLTDVFGLGAVLYRLLTGRPPRDPGTSPQQTITLPSRVVRDTTELPLAQRRARARELHGDLDTIVFKALSSEPERRYPSVEALAADLRAFLENRPISAHAGSVWYHTSRFVRRNRFAVASAILVLAFFAGAVWQIVRERDRAEVQAMRAVEVRDFLADVFGSAATARGHVPSLSDVLDEGSRRAREELIKADPLAAADVLTITGATYRNSSDYDKAKTDLVEARRILLGVQPPPPRELSQVCKDLGMLARMRGDTAQSVAHLRESLDWAKQSNATPAQLMRIEMSLAASENYAGHPQVAEETLRRLLVELDPQQLRNSEFELDILNALGTSLALQKRAYPEQATLHERRLALTRTLYGEDDGWYAYALADAVPTLRKAGQIERAERIAREAVAITDRIYDKPQMFAAVANCNLAALLQHEGRYADALAPYDRSIAIDDAIRRNDMHVESCRRGRAYSRAAMTDFSGASADLSADRDILARLGKQQSTLWLSNCGLEASILLRQHRVNEAGSLLDRCAVEHSPKPAEEVNDFELARTEVELNRQQWDAAGRRLDTLRERLPPSAAERTWLRPWLLSILVASKRGDAAERARLIAAIEAIEPAPGMRDLAIVRICLDADAPSLSDCMTLP